MQIEEQGPTSVFNGPMGAASTRLAKSITFLAASTFTSLTFMYDAAEPGAANPNVPTYPVLSQIRDVKSFRLLTGACVVIFYAN